MIHQAAQDGRYFWGVSASSLEGRVLAQFQAEGEQVRVVLTAEEAARMAGELLRFAQIARQGLPDE